MFESRKVEEYIDTKCVDFPFPQGYKSLFSEEEIQDIAKMGESARKLLKEVNKVKIPKSEKISADKLIEYYKVLMIGVLGETFVDRVERMLSTMKLNSYEKEAMENFKEEVKAKVEAKEGELLKTKLHGVLNKKTKR